MFLDVYLVRHSPLVTWTLQGCKRRLSKPVQQKIPLGLNDLAQIVAVIQHEDDCCYDSTLFLAMLLTGFKSLQYLSEMTWPDTTMLQCYKKVCLHHTLSLTATSASYMLPYQKNDTLGLGCKIVIQSEPHSSTDALQHMLRYLEARDSTFLHHPALWVTNAGTIPTHSWFLWRLHHFSGSAFSGHSMRAGGATALTATGMSLDLIQASG
jgi:hypothetical protein